MQRLEDRKAPQQLAHRLAKAAEGRAALGRGSVEMQLAEAPIEQLEHRVLGGRDGLIVDELGLPRGGEKALDLGGLHEALRRLVAVELGDRLGIDVEVVEEERDSTANTG